LNVCLLHKEKAFFLCLLAALESSAPSTSRKISSPDDRCTTGAATNPRASSLVENLNSRLHNYFFLRRQLGFPVSGLATIFPQSSHLMRSVSEQVAKSQHSGGGSTRLVRAFGFRAVSTPSTHPHTFRLFVGTDKPSSFSG